MTVPSLLIAPIVEGHGDVAAVPVLLRRICAELLGGRLVHVLRPIRQPRDRLLNDKDGCLARSLELAIRKLKQSSIPSVPELVLLLVDADHDCAAEGGPRTLELAARLRGDADIAVVWAVWEYETWFVAAAESLHHHLNLDPSTVPSDPEASRCRKNWIERHWRVGKYSESVDQPKLTACMDLPLCRRRSPSFDKLCREMERRLSGGSVAH